jgi:hypothetical protein
MRLSATALGIFNAPRRTDVGEPPISALKPQLVIEIRGFDDVELRSTDRAVEVRSLITVDVAQAHPWRSICPNQSIWLDRLRGQVLHCREAPPSLRQSVAPGRTQPWKQPAAEAQQALRVEPSSWNPPVHGVRGRTIVEPTDEIQSHGWPLVCEREQGHVQGRQPIAPASPQSLATPCVGH